MSVTNDVLYHMGGVPVHGRMTTGSCFFVDSNTGSDGNSGKKPSQAFATADYAVSKCTPNKGDIIYCMPKHAETTGKVTLDVDGVSLIGIGDGLQRPAFGTADADDIITITGSNVTVENLQIGTLGIDAITSFINIAGSGATVRNIYATDCSTTSINIVDVFTITADGDDCLIENVHLFNTTVAVVSFIHFEGAASHVTIKDFYAFGDVATGGLIDTAKVDYLVMDNVHIAVVGTTIPAATLGSNPEGMAVNCSFFSTSATIAVGCALGNLMRTRDVKTTNETDNSASAFVYPTVDAAT